jgi:purine operon repressor
MMDLLQEFNAVVKGIGVFVESTEVEERLVDQYVSLARMSAVDPKTKQVVVTPGNYFDHSH